MKVQVKVCFLLKLKSILIGCEVKKMDEKKVCVEYIRLQNCFDTWKDYVREHYTEASHLAKQGKVFFSDQILRMLWIKH